MLKSAIVRIVDFCTRYPWWVLALALILSAASAVYAARHFAIKTDINELISKQLPWTQRATEYMAAFPQREILAVVDAPTPELVEQAATKLAEVLQGRPDVIRAVRQPQSGSFFERNGLLFLSTEEVARVTDGLTRADALLETLAADPSLRGTLDALSFGVMGVERKELKLDDMTRPMTLAADTVEDVVAGRPASFSWRVLASGKPAQPGELRRFIEVEPVLDFSALQPGLAATNAIARTAADLHLAENHRARVRQTGLIPIDDDEFGTIRQNAGINATVSLLAVLLILWLSRTANSDTVALMPAFCRMVPNSSSSMGIRPVWRTRARWFSARCRSAAVPAIALVATRPGCSALKSSTGSISMNRRRSRGCAGLPLASTRQEKLAGRPARTSSTVSAASVIGRVISSSLSSLRSTPMTPNDSASSVPLRLGSAASVSSRASARVKPSVTRATSSVGRNSNPLRSKKLPLWGWRTARMTSWRACRASASLVAACSTSSGVGASTTARISRCGKAAMYSVARCVQGSCFEISSLMSVLMAKCRAA